MKDLEKRRREERGRRVEGTVFLKKNNNKTIFSENIVFRFGCVANRMEAIEVIQIMLCILISETSQSR